jgi:hypothetical protein
MRVLFLHPDDSARQGPWSRQKWELIVDLGKSSPFSEEAWREQYGCRIVRAESFRHGVTDARRVRQIFSAFRGKLLDNEGLDWWELTSLLAVPEALSILAFKNLAEEIGGATDLWVTRRGALAHIVEVLLGRPLRSFADGGWSRFAARAMHYTGVVRRLSAAQFKQVVLDKYDSRYRWRSRFASRHKRAEAPVVLIPSAYGNVSRMASDYARLLPEQPFLVVATRQNAQQFDCPPNVQVRDLAGYATPDDSAREVGDLTGRWNGLLTHLEELPELRELARAGVFDSIPAWLRDGLHARNAWREVLEREPIAGVLCGDDSNLYTRLPVLLAAKRKIPTVDFHHGALDGRYLLKELPCDVYLAKNEMERDFLVTTCGLPQEKIAIGSPPHAKIATARKESSNGRSIVFFSEPYEVAGMRAEETYRELLPPLCRLARENGRSILLKLHPFESKAQRGRLLSEIVAEEDRKIIHIVDGPLRAELVAQAWFGITLESTTAIDCLQQGVCCFLCGWMTLGPYEYGRQYARFGIGEVLESANEISEIPARLVKFDPTAASKVDLHATVDPAMLQRWLTGSPATPGARSTS